MQGQVDNLELVYRDLKLFFNFVVVSFMDIPGPAVTDLLQRQFPRLVFAIQP
jgi:hypothetical protein